MTKRKEPVHKDRGCLLSGWVIFIMLHGILASLLILYLRQQQNDPSPTWVLVTLFVLAMADIVAAIAMWYWKRWGLMLYAISTVIGIAIGLVLTRSQLWIFHDILPLVILGYLIKDNRRYFE
jgi:hypothetical protein